MTNPPDPRNRPASGRPPDDPTPDDPTPDGPTPDGLDLAGIRDRLTDRHRQIVALADSTAAARQPVELDQTRVGRLSRMDALQDQAMSLATAQRRAAELKRIEAALARLADGAFGYCASCGEPIAVKRLDLDPTTPICVGCAKKAQ